MHTNTKGQVSGLQVRVAGEGTHGRDAQGHGQLPDARQGHTISAKRLARKNCKDGNLTKDESDRIERKADKVIADS